MCEKINKMERKNNAKIIMMHQGSEVEDFWEPLGGYQEDFTPEVRLLLTGVASIFEQGGGGAKL